MNGHLLSWIIFTPLVGAIAILFCPKNNTQLLRTLSLLTTFMVGIFSFWAILLFDTSKISIAESKANL